MFWPGYVYPLPFFWFILFRSVFLSSVFATGSSEQYMLSRRTRGMAVSLYLYLRVVVSRGDTVQGGRATLLEHTCLDGCVLFSVFFSSSLCLSVCRLMKPLLVFRAAGDPGPFLPSWAYIDH
jgi:hypothetical protein